MFQGLKGWAKNIAPDELRAPDLHWVHFIVHESHARVAYILPQPAPAHLGLVPGLSISPTAPGDLFILGLNFGDDSIQVQVPAVVHLHDDRCL